MKAHTKLKVRVSTVLRTKLFRWQKLQVILVRWEYELQCCPHCRESLSTRRPAKARARAHPLEGHLPEGKDELSLNVRPVSDVIDNHNSNICL